MRRYRAIAPVLEAVSVVGAGDVLLAQFLAAELAGKSAEEALRLAVGAGAASTLEVERDASSRATSAGSPGASRSRNSTASQRGRPSRRLVRSRLS